MTANASGVAGTANFSLTNTTQLAGTLSGSGTSSEASVNLTAEGSLDWEHSGEEP